MKESFRRTLSPSEQQAKIAADMFIRVSMEIPASVVLQGASIALECHKKKLHPNILGVELINNPTKINAITNAANRVHTRSRKDINPVTPERTVEIVRHCFYWADCLLFLKPEEIEDFIKSAPPGKTAEDETIRRMRAIAIMQKRIKQM